MLFTFITVNLKQIALIGIIVVAAGIALWFLLSLLAAFIVYTITLHRWNKKKWTRECSSDDPRQLKMYAEGLEWCRQHEDKKISVSIKNNGLNLYGEYFDLGFDRTAVLVSGRTEGLKYSYFFAKPYAESGFNIFVFDQRAHGLSDGHCNTLGFEESKDLIKWCEYLHDEMHTKEIYLHGICIGSACSLYTMLNKNAPDYLIGMTADGMYSNFFRSFENHAKEKVKHLFPVTDMVDWWLLMFTGHSMKKGPIDCIGRYRKPLLMLHSKEDTYSVPEYASELYKGNPSEVKELVWFDHGGHSMLRITDSEKYDEVIKTYLTEHFGS